jgi:hypothetical protein
MFFVFWVVFVLWWMKNQVVAWMPELIDVSAKIVDTDKRDLSTV